jgi:GTP cyclohydrolase I
MPRAPQTVRPADDAAMRDALSAFLRACGLDESHPDLKDTAARVAGFWRSEFLDGYHTTAAEAIGEPVVDEADPDLVVVAGLRFHAMCPHHLVPYRGTAAVAYMPQGKLAGFGRLARLVDVFTHRLTLQERASVEIAEALSQTLGARGAGCVLRAEQLCLALPGERHDQSAVTTLAFVGEMRERPDLQARLVAASE